MLDVRDGSTYACQKLPKPRTPVSEPKALNPLTLNPKPQTLNPKPQTLSYSVERGLLHGLRDGRQRQHRVNSALPHGHKAIFEHVLKEPREGLHGLRLEFRVYPKVSKDQTNGVLGPRYCSLNAIWGLWDLRLGVQVLRFRIQASASGA